LKAPLPVLGLLLAAILTLTAREKTASDTESAAGPWKCRSVQGRPFWFTLGGGVGSAEHDRTLKQIPLADPEPAQCGVGEWEYSFHHLKNGEADGAGHKHYGGYPTPPRDRAEAMAVVRRYYERLREEALAKATPEQRQLFISVNGHYCYQHYACAWGCDVVGSEVGENINSIQAHIAFTRGAARQYGKPWLMDFSSWYGPGIFDEDPRRTWGDNSDPNHGHSLSLHQRSYFVSYLAGANIVVAEGGWLNCFKSQTAPANDPLPLSALGEKAAQFYRFTRRHPDRGIPYTPVALLLPFDHGIYPGFDRKLSWNAFPYTPGDQRILDALNVFFPGSLGDRAQPERADRQPANPAWKDPEYMHTEALRLVASPFGDLLDVLVDTAPLEVLHQYPVLVLAGCFTPNDSRANRLSGYVAAGGVLVLDQADIESGVLPPRLIAQLRRAGPARAKPIRFGKGQVQVLASADPSHPTADRPLAKFLASQLSRFIPLSVSGRVETLFNRTPDGWLVTLVNNEGITKTFHEPPVIDPLKQQVVNLQWHGKRKLRQATLWGADSDEPLDCRRLAVSVPPGEVRVISLRY